MELAQKKAYIFDMDGTINIGSKPLPGAVELFKKLKQKGKEVVVLTNNSSRTSREHLEKLVDMGFERGTFSVYSSVDATITHLQRHHKSARVYLLGTRSVRQEFVESGVQITDESPDVVVLAFDTELTYEKLKRFCHFVRRGALYIATHPDINCPSEEGPIPDAGSLMAAVESSTGKLPDVIVGKPNPHLIYSLLERLKLGRSDVALIGDRLYTDIEMAKKVGIDAVLVLSGETKREDLMCSLPSTVQVLDSVAKILEFF
ncbi:MAG: HAD-IIA family hydrolase [Thermotogae bacterium]|nr:HAD-IIA family hydrolase [Thermotogota bacterium]